MLNSQDFIKKLEILLDHYQLSASAFADKIGVQRSSLSHLLSGRNKPGLDFILKIIAAFPEVDLYWILNDQGNFPREEPESNPPKSQSIQAKPPVPVAKDSNEAQETHPIITPTVPPEEDAIEKIVVFYKNGLFKSYLPK